MAESKINKETQKSLDALTAKMDAGFAIMAKLPTTESVDAQMAAMQDQFEEVKKQLVDPTGFASAEAVNALEIKLEAIAKGVEEVLTENEELKETVEKLTTVRSTVNVQAPDTKKPVEVPTETFKVDKQNYRFKFARFTLPNKGTVNAEEALMDKKLCKEIVADFPSIVEAV
jgi:uncharacterized membrane-anchored protein YhcB (DUF1043 family)